MMVIDLNRFCRRYSDSDLKYSWTHNDCFGWLSYSCDTDVNMEVLLLFLYDSSN